MVEGGLEDWPGLVERERPITLVAAPGLAKIHCTETQPRDTEPAIAELQRLQHGLPPKKTEGEIKVHARCAQRQSINLQRLSGPNAGVQPSQLWRR